jgi:hypothetical protein
MRIIHLFTLLAAGAFTTQAALIHEYLFNNGVTDSAGSAHGSLQGAATVSGGILSFGPVQTESFVQFGEFLVRRREATPSFSTNARVTARSATASSR